jgi:hypothetical protein
MKIIKDQQLIRETLLNLSIDQVAYLRVSALSNMIYRKTRRLNKNDRHVVSWIQDRNDINQDGSYDFSRSCFLESGADFEDNLESMYDYDSDIYGTIGYKYTLVLLPSSSALENEAVNLLGFEPLNDAKEA